MGSRTTTIALAAGALALMTACTSAAGQHDPAPGRTTANPAGSTSTTGPSITATADSPAPATSSAPVLDTAQLQGALLSTTDVTGYRTTRITDGNRSRLPCTARQPALVQQYPPAADAQAAYSSTTTRSAFRETLLAYTQLADAQAAYAAVQDGFNCATGTLGGVTVRIARVGAVQQGGYRGERWDFTLADGTLGSAVVGQVGSTVVEINFVATQAGSSEADPGKVLQTALAKLGQHTPH